MADGWPDPVLIGLSGLYTHLAFWSTGVDAQQRESSHCRGDVITAGSHRFLPDVASV